MQHLNLVVVQGFTLVLVEDAIEVIVSVFDWDEGGKDDCVGAVMVRGVGGRGFWCHRVHPLTVAQHDEAENDWLPHARLALSCHSLP